MIGKPEPFPIGNRTVNLIRIDIDQVFPRSLSLGERSDFVRTIAGNAIAVAGTCDSEMISAGIGWYRLARRESRMIAREYGLTLAQSAGIVAALSPRTEWFENLRRARIVAETGEPYGMNPHGSRAASIANGSNPLATLSGPKVRAFYRNIRGNYVPVAIDIWNLRVAIGTRSAGNREYHRLERLGMYGLVESGFQLGARMFSDSVGLEIQPAELAAIDWLAIREPVP